MMMKIMNNKNIILCGFMGSGKTTVGRILSSMMGRKFVDLDDYIETQQQTTIENIFKEYGEPHFRHLETAAAEELSKKSNLIIAAGGGTLTIQKNVATFKATGVVVMLDTPLTVIKERLKEDTTRPLLQKPNRNAVIDQLYQNRLFAYKSAADIIVPAGASAHEVANLLMHKFSI